MSTSSGRTVFQSTGARAERNPEESGSILLRLSTRYVGEQLYAIPDSALDQLVADLQALKAAGSSHARNGQKAAEPSPQAVSATKPEGRSFEVKVTTPQKWMIGSGLPQRSVVVLIFDPQSESQAGYALGGESAKQMAAGLIKQADALALAASSGNASARPS
jgi:hypothetical protein